MRAVVSLLVIAGVLSAQNLSKADEKEAALGAVLAQQVGRQTLTVKSTAVQNYIEALGRQLASQVSETPIQWTFAVVARSSTGVTREPLELPGGYIFVPVQLILDCRTEAQLAGMLAHAMAHGYERHFVKQVATNATIPLVFVGGWSGDYREGALLPAGVRSAWRSYEFEADRYAARLMSKAGFDPEALAQYLDGRNDDRAAALRQTIQAQPQATYTLSNEQFQAIQQEVRHATPAGSDDDPPRFRRAPSLSPQ